MAYKGVAARVTDPAQSAGGKTRRSPPACGQVSAGRSTCRRRGTALPAGALALATYLLGMLTGAPAAWAQMCGDAFLSQQPNNTTLFQVDVSGSMWEFLPLGTADVEHNALGHRVEDGILYAILDESTELLQVNTDGTTTTLGVVTGLPDEVDGYNSGAFAPDGFYYVNRATNPDRLFRIDVETQQVLAEIPFTLPGRILDLVWFEDRFYGVSEADGNLVSIDMNTGMVDVIGPTGLTVPTPVGAMFGASNGVFGVHNGGGAYEFDIETGTATLLADSPSSSINDGARCLDAPLQIEVDLAVTKTDNSDTYLPGTDVVYEIVVTNNGPHGAQNAMVDDPLPAGISTASWTCEAEGPEGSTQCGAESGTGALSDTPNVEVGGEVTYTLTLSVPPDFTGDLVNTVTVEAPEGITELDLSNNTATDTDTPGEGASIDLEKSGSGPEPLEVGSVIEYSFEVTNTGGVELTEVTVTDPLPGMSPIECPGDTLAPGESMTCTSNYTVTQEDVDAGQIDNTATTTGDPPGDLPPVTDEDSATFPTPVPALPPLALVLLLALLTAATLGALRRVRGTARRGP